MSRILVLGAAGSLGRHVTRQAVAANHEVSTLVRTPAKLPAELRAKVVLHQADLASMSVSALPAILRGHDAVINTAGMVMEGQVFVDLVDRIVTALESVPEEDRPVCWFLAGAALLDLDARGRRGVDLPRVASTYWPHRANFDRIRQTALDWRILCPGPMVDDQPLGLARMRISLHRVPVHVPSFLRFLPGALVLPFFISSVPEMIVPYADAAALMLANLAPAGEMSRHRVGLALPVGRRGKKEHWAAKPERGLAERLGTQPSPTSIYQLMGIGDVGRVFLDDESSDVWHAAAGGGLWISWLDGAGSLAISVVASSERTMLYAGSALSY